jgi:hypothetical protein
MNEPKEVESTTQSQDQQTQATGNVPATQPQTVVSNDLPARQPERFIESTNPGNLKKHNE